MEVSAIVKNTRGAHEVTLRTDANVRPLVIASKTTGRGSAVNGGELLMAALATCYCNDLFREAQRLGLTLESVEVEASATFEGIGLAASDIRYKARIQSPASSAEVAELLKLTDGVAEIHNTLRAGVPVTLMP